MKYFIILLVLSTVILHYINSETTSLPGVGMRDAKHGASLPTNYPHTTVKILDGDTFVYNGEHVRLIGLNSPEIYHGDKQAQCGSYQSMSRLEYYLTRIRPSSMIRIDRQGKDKYGRTLAIVYIDNDPISVNSRLVKEGFAEPFRPEGGVPAPNYDAEYQTAINNLSGNLSHCTNL